MTTLREAAQQALEALEEIADEVFSPYDNKLGDAILALRAALAQQDEPLNLTDPAVQKRLATQWGYVPAAQAEPVEPVAWLAPDGSVRETTVAKSFGEWVWGPDDFKPLYTAPPQRKPLTKEEILRAFYAAEKPPMSIRHGLSVVESARIVERAHGIGETK